MIRQTTEPRSYALHTQRIALTSYRPARADVLTSCGLALLPVTAVLGDYLPSAYVARHPISIFRLLTVLMFLMGLGIHKRPLWMKTPINRSFMLVMGAWLVWGTTSLIWTPDTPRGVIEILAIAFGLLVVVVLIQWCGANEHSYRALRFGWVLALLVSCGAGAWEGYSGQHLANDHSAFMNRYYRETDYVQSFFGNQNNFGAFLVLATPFLFHGLIAEKTKRIRYLVLLILAASALGVTDSRISLVAFGVELVVGIYLLGKEPQVQHLLHRAGMVGLLIVLLSFTLSSDRLRGKLNLWASDSRADQSTEFRANQIRNGIQAVMETAGLGVGAGGFQNFVKDRAEHDTSSWSGQLVDPHAAIVEIGAQYGLLILFLVLAVILRLLRYLWTTTRRKNNPKAVLHLGIVGSMGVIGIIGASFANSTFLPVGFTWVFMGSLLVVATQVEPERKERFLRTQSVPAIRDERS